MSRPLPCVRWSYYSHDQAEGLLLGFRVEARASSTGRPHGASAFCYITLPNGDRVRGEARHVQGKGRALHDAIHQAKVRLQVSLERLR